MYKRNTEVEDVIKTQVILLYKKKLLCQMSQHLYIILYISSFCS